MTLWDLAGIILLMNKNKLFLMVGASFTGKTTKAEKLLKEIDNSVICRDLLSTQDGLAAGKSVIVDLPNLTAADREPYIKLAKDSGLKVEAWAFISSFESINKRAMGRIDEEFVKGQLRELKWPVQGEVHTMVVVSPDGEEFNVLGNN